MSERMPLKGKGYVYVLQLEADHRRSKNPFTEVRWNGPHFFEKVLAKNKFLDCKTGTDKTHVLHHMRLLQFIPQQPIPVVEITPREWKPDPEVTSTLDDLCARAWECEYEKPTFDNDHDNLPTPKSPEIEVRSELAADEFSNIPGTVRESSAEFFPRADRSRDGTDMDHCKEPDADTSVEQPNPTPTNCRSTTYDLRHNPKLNCSNPYRCYTFNLSHYGLRNAYAHLLNS